MTQINADFARLNRGLSRITQINADFGASRGSAFFVGVGAAQLTHKKTGEAQGLPLQNNLSPVGAGSPRPIGSRIR